MLRVLDVHPQKDTETQDVHPTPRTQRPPEAHHRPPGKETLVGPFWNWGSRMVAWTPEDSLTSPQWVAWRVTACPSSSTPRYTAKRNENTHPRKDSYVRGIAALLIRATKWESPKCLSTDESINGGRFSSHKKERSGDPRCDTEEP